MGSTQQSFFQKLSPVPESAKEQWIKYLNNLKAIKSVVKERIFLM